MTYTSYIIYFLFFSFVGWIIDSIYSSFEQKRIINSGYFKELPLCPLYGVGGITLLLLAEYFQGVPWIIAILISACMMNIVEYVGGIFCVTVMKERLWDYRSHKWNIHGHIDALHAFFWLVLTVVFYQYIYPIITTIHQTVWPKVSISSHMDETIFLFFCLTAFVFTFKRRRRRLAYATGRKMRRRYSR